MTAPFVEYRAGGTDLSERRRSGVSRGPVRDLGARTDLARITTGIGGGLDVGALVTVAQVAADPTVRAGYPGLAAAAAGLATPQIRRMATIGGNLLQRSRCWYYRNPHVSCLKSGGSTCPARDGNHLFSVAFDLGPCVAPHPSTIGAALLAYDAHVSTDRRRELPVAQVFGDGSDGGRDHQLAADELLTTVHLPPPVAGESAAYHRAITRTYAEWPLAEAVARLVVTDGAITLASVGVGGVAPVPLRLPAVEAHLIGRPPTTEVIASAARHATHGAQPLPQTGYKIPLLIGTVVEVLERAADPTSA